MTPVGRHASTLYLGLSAEDDAELLAIISHYLTAPFAEN